MDAKKRNIIIGAAIGAVVLVLGVVACLGIFRGFNPKGYVEAILNQTFKGKVNAAVQMIEGATEKQLKAQYEAGVTSFVKNTIAGGVEMDAELEEKYVTLCKKIFDDMKYKVKGYQTVDGGYEVTVEYQTADVLQKYVASAESETQRINEKVENGDYRGTLEEINTQMKKDFLSASYTILEKAYKNMEYGEKQTVVLTVQKGTGDLYELSGEEITQFIKKIMGLDAIQD